MRISPKVMAFIYFTLGLLFTYIAMQTAGDSIWNFSTVVLALIASLDFGASIRLISIHFKVKKQNKKK